MSAIDTVHLADALWDALRDICCLSGRDANQIPMVQRIHVHRAVRKLHMELTTPTRVVEGELVKDKFD